MWTKSWAEWMNRESISASPTLEMVVLLGAEKAFDRTGSTLPRPDWRRKCPFRYLEQMLPLSSCRPHTHTHTFSFDSSTPTLKFLTFPNPMPLNCYLWCVSCWRQVCQMPSWPCCVRDPHSQTLYIVTLEECVWNSVLYVQHQCSS